jgi:hypothetical protein
MKRKNLKEIRTPKLLFSKSLRLYTIMICMIVSLNPKIVIGQETGNRSMLSGEIYCSNMNFEFEVENSYHKDGDKIYVCPKNIPVTE